MNKQIKTVKKIVATYFLNDKGKPFKLTNGQALFFIAITNKKFRWVWMSAPTRYGKTETLAIALIYCAVFYHLKIPIVGGSQDKAAKIMEYVVQHLGDHPDLYAGLLNIQDIHDVDKLKVTVSKKVLRWNDGGWIYITSVDSRSKVKEGEGVVGEGGDIVVLEEAGLIKNVEQFSKVVRMPEEDGGWGKLIMSGNCIEGSVFEKAYNNPLYKKIRIDLEQAVAEGRFTQSYLDEKKTQTTSKDWKRYYLVAFPLANEFTYFKPTKYDLLPKELKYYGSIDPSLGESKKSSKIGIIVIGKDAKGQEYEVESIVKHIKPEEAIRIIFNFPYTFQRFGFEAIAFQKYFLKLTKAKSKELGLNIPFEGLTQSKNKTERIESLEPPINTGIILFKGDNQLWEDMQEYPKTEFLDGLDALEMAHKLCEKMPTRIAFGDDSW